MKRRTFFATAAAVGLGAAVETAESQAAEVQSPEAQPVYPPSCSLDGNTLSFYAKGIDKPFRALFIADTHLWRDDPRGEPHREYSKRMAGAYHVTKHFRTGEWTHPEESFVAALQHAKELKAELILLGGDIFSYPSEAAIDWALEQIAAASIPYVYVAGNHDWHYEGMEGNMDSLREEWTAKRLAPLYQSQNPLMSARDVNGVRFLAIDDSTYEIRPEQLDFFRTQTKAAKPTVLMMHIPLYAPGRGLGFGCGHPDWGAATDENYGIERRPRWPESGHTQTTFDFDEAVFSAPNLMGVLAGHTHRKSVDVVRGTPQFVTDANANGAYIELEFVPLP